MRSEPDEVTVPCLPREGSRYHYSLTTPKSHPEPQKAMVAFLRVERVSLSHVSRKTQNRPLS